MRNSMATRLICGKRESRSLPRLSRRAWPGHKRRGRKVFGHARTEKREMLCAYREDSAAEVMAPAKYTVAQAVDDWLADGPDGRSEKSAEKYRYVLKPAVAKISRSALRDYTAHETPTWVVRAFIDIL